MKILYVSGMYPNPKYKQKGIFCHEQVKALINLGHTVDVIVPITFYDRTVKVKEWEYEGVKVKYVKFFKIPSTFGFQNIGKHFYNALKRTGIDFSVYDVLHADAPLPTGIALEKLGKKFNKPVVIHGHGLDVFLEGSYAGASNVKLISKVSQKAYREADAICGVSQKVLDKISEKVDISGKSYVVFNGVDDKKFFPSEEKPTEKYILTVGNLIPLKGHDATIKAFSEVAKEDSSVKLIIAGDGELKESLIKFTEELGIKDRVEFKGYIPYDEIAKLMRNAILFCMPSWFEALGCVYLESMASGVATIGCKGNGIDEIIKDGVNGFLVEKDEIAKIVEIMKKAIHGELDSIAKQGLKDVKENYTWASSAKSLEKVYGQVIK